MVSRKLFQICPRTLRSGPLGRLSNRLIPDPTQAVNPVYRQLEGKLGSGNAELHRRLAEFGAFNLWQPIEPQHVEPFMQKKAALQEQIETLQAELKTLKDQRKATPHHIAAKDLPDDERFRRLSTHAKHLLDTIKMLAYRAESAMANVSREHLGTGLDAIHGVIGKVGGPATRA